MCVLHDVYPTLLIGRLYMSVQIIFSFKFLLILYHFRIPLAISSLVGCDNYCTCYSVGNQSN